ncbi:MAG: CvpA family protein [Lachnospiraceae bacterium]|nr:CvpA family protein [Lachnospiraceae bacterium]
MNIALVVVLLILIVNAFYGRKAGLIKTVFSLFSMVAAVLLSSFISPQVSKVLQENEAVVEYMSDKVEAVLPLEDLGNKITDQISFVDSLPIPASMKTSIIENNNSDTYAQMAVDNFTAYITHAVANIILNAIAFIVTFLVIIIVLNIVCSVLNIISKLPILNQINKTAGMLVGIAQGLIIIWVLGILVTVFSGSTMGQEIFKMINENEFLSFLYDNNLILRFIANVFL